MDRILKKRKTFAQKEEDWESIISICSNEEPHLDLFAHTLFQRILARTTPIGEDDKTYSTRGCTELTVKQLLLELNPQAVHTISGQRFETIVTSTSSTLPDPSKPYAGVYMAGFLQRNKPPLHIRSVLRLANILIHTARLRALSPATAGSRLLKGCEVTGKAGRMVLEDSNLCVHLYEFSLDDDSAIDSPLAIHHRLGHSPPSNTIKSDTIERKRISAKGRFNAIAFQHLFRQGIRHACWKTTGIWLDNMKGV
jgi:hypothetical protein